MKKILLFTFFIILFKSFINKNIAIIGSGISGISCAYFLFKKHNKIHIDIFEKNDYIGGRMFAKTYKDININLGASFFLSENLLINELIEFTKLTKKSLHDKHLIAILNKKFEKLLQIDDGFFYNMYNFITKYNFAIFDINNIVNNYLQKLNTIYNNLDENKYFEKIVDLINKLGFTEDDLSKTTKDYYSDKINNKFIDEFITPLILSCYNQGNEINPISGGIILTASIKKAYTLKEGFTHFINNLYQRLKEEYYNQISLNLNLEIRKIFYNRESKKYKLDVNNDIEYDDIIIATNNIKNIEIINIDIVLPKFEFLITTEIVVKGKIDFRKLNLDENLDYTAILFQDKITDLNISDIIKIENNLYKIQINDNKFSELDLKWLFIDEKYEMIFFKKWNEPYPKLNPIKDIKRLSDYKLQDGLYFVNAIEQVVSCLELSIISAKNISNMIIKNNYKLDL